MRLLKDAFKRLLKSRGYEIYRRPYLPKGIDPFASLVSHWPNWQPRVIFDVGANAGQTVARLRSHFHEAEIHAFEPVPSTCDLLRKNVTVDRRTHAHCLALAERDGEAWINLHDQSDLNSLTPALAPFTDKPGRRVRVELQTLSHFCTTAGISHIDLLKIDVEGQERQVLEGALPLLDAGAVDFILVEAGLMPGEPRFTPLSSLFDVLVPRDFWLVGIYEQYGWRHTQSAEFCNALFALKKHLR